MWKENRTVNESQRLCHNWNLKVKGNVAHCINNFSVEAARPVYSQLSICIANSADFFTRKQ